MISSLQRLLLEKYQPDSPLLKPTVEAPTPIQKAAAHPEKVMHVIMSSADYSDTEITKALHTFNTKLIELPLSSRGRNLLSSSYQLPTTMNGIPTGSWVLVANEVIPV